MLMQHSDCTFGAQGVYLGSAVALLREDGIGVLAQGWHRVHARCAVLPTAGWNQGGDGAFGGFHCGPALACL